MIVALLIAASTAAASPVAPAASQPVNLTEAAHAIDVGRLDQARQMVGRAIAVGAKGPLVDRLLADLAFASGANAEALPRYEQLLAKAPADTMLAEHAGIAALRVGDLERARRWLERATGSPSASWRAWNARGALADLQGDRTAADAAYDKAARIAPDRAEVINNQGWSLLLRGNWREALARFERAAERDPKSTRIANNLELARAALASDLPQRRDGESDADWAGRLNDAGIAAQVLGDRQRAVAAFTQALEASGRWYDRAANNLKLAGGAR